MAFDPYKVDLLILSHAHIDHTGRVSQLDKHGSEGNTHCSIYNFSFRSILKILDLEMLLYQKKDKNSI